MARTRVDRYKNWKVITFWFLGSITLLLGTLIAGHVDISPGTSTLAFLFAITVALVLFIITGLLWISTAVAVKELEE